MADYTSIGSFNTGGAASLNGELIQKLYDAEAKSTVDPLTERLELMETESTVINDINTKVNELIAAIKPFDLFASGNNAFEQISATTTGDSAIFDAADVGALKEGTININISQLAQKDIYQSNTTLSKDALIDAGILTIDVDGVGGNDPIDFDTTGKTYAELLEDINLSGTIDASIEQVSDTEFRLLIKSQKDGIENQLSITGSAATALGYDLDADMDGELDNRVLKAQNLNATIDGVSYDISANSITLDGNLKITASKTGDASISIQKDDSSIVPAVQEFVEKYNELLLMVTEELYSENASVQDRSSLNSLVSDIKNMMFGEHGSNNDSLLNFGFSFDKTGALEVDASILGKALTEDANQVKALFIGVAEDKGFGTKLKEHLDDLNAYDGFFSTYDSAMSTRKINLEEDKEKAVKNLDTKYDTMAAQFSAYASIISQLESSFSGLKQMIAAENSSN